MVKRGKIATFLLGATVLGIMAGSMAGCSDARVKRADALNDKLTTVAVAMEDSIDNFLFTGADVDKSGFIYNVSFNGLAQLKDKSNAFASVNYSIPHDEFLDLKKTSSANDVYDVFDYIVDNFEADKVSLSRVGDIKRFNNAISSNTPSPFENYNIKRGFVYNLTEPEFDDSTRTVNFDVKMIMELKKTKRPNGIFIPYYGFGVGYLAYYSAGRALYRHVQEGTFMTMEQYSFTFSEEEYERIKQDPNSIYDICSQTIENGDDSFMKVERIYTNDVTYDNADLLDKIDFESAVDEMDL